MARRMPTKEEIEKLAKALYYEEHPEAAATGITPEREELSEGNYLIKARNLLLRGEEGPILAEYERMKSMWIAGVRKEAETFDYTLIPKKRLEEYESADLAKLSEELEVTRAQIDTLKGKLKRGEISRREFERQKDEEVETLRAKVRELTGLLSKAKAVKVRILKPFTWGVMRLHVGDVLEVEREEARRWISMGNAEEVAPEVPLKIVPPPVAPPKPPVVKPPVKVLPPVPEVCPICGTPLTQMEKVPLLIRDPLRLSAEEEDWRAAAGIPLPTITAEMIDIPATMKVWVCKEDHYFERDAAGRLVQRTPEFLYKKILRETAKLRKLRPPELVPRPVYVPFRPPPAKLKPPGASPKRWLLETHGLTWGEFLKLPNEKRKALLEEYVRLSRERT